jgi:hypothetical protein
VRRRFTTAARKPAEGGETAVRNGIVSWYAANIGPAKVAIAAPLLFRAYEPRLQEAPFEDVQPWPATPTRA